MNVLSENCKGRDNDYLKLLSTKFPSIAAASTEIINLEAICNLPKGTEHFITDLHGEYDAFQHVLRNASGVIRTKIEILFCRTLSKAEREELVMLVYYPEEKLDSVISKQIDMSKWYKEKLNNLLDLCRMVSSKYTRSKVRKSLPTDFAYIIEELLHEAHGELNKQIYFNVIVESIIETDRAYSFVVALSNLIQRLSIDRLHIVGDIYDRGSGAHTIMDRLLTYHSFDIQWGNHDVIWMGAACGSEACIANVVRICARYANFETLQDGYGINILPIARFAMETYKDDPCTYFIPKFNEDNILKETDIRLLSQIHKAIAIIQFKAEHQIISRREDFEMGDRDLLHRIDFDKGTIILDGVEHTLKDNNFPTIDRENPYQLTAQEQEVMDKLKISFANSDKLHSHINCLFAHGALYLKFNNNLLFHASLPMTKEGEFTKVNINGEVLSGKPLLDKLDTLCRRAYYGRNNSKEEYAVDYLWYLWCGVHSPLFGKNKMATFERYFISDKSTHKEVKSPYFSVIDQREVLARVFNEFDLDMKSSHLINGHVPVKYSVGENPIKAGGKRLVIDGGFSKAYQGETGIAGFTLIYNSYGLHLVRHNPFESRLKAIECGRDIISSKFIVENCERVYVGGTDIGKELKQQISDLKELLMAYRKGIIKEKL